jgi:hypothetical protein
MFRSHSGDLHTMREKIELAHSEAAAAAALNTLTQINLIILLIYEKKNYY